MLFMYITVVSVSPLRCIVTRRAYIMYRDTVMTSNTNVHALVGDTRPLSQQHTRPYRHCYAHIPTIETTDDTANDTTYVHEPSPHTRRSYITPITTIRSFVHNTIITAVVDRLTPPHMRTTTNDSNTICSNDDDNDADDDRTNTTANLIALDRMQRNLTHIDVFTNHIDSTPDRIERPHDTHSDYVAASPSPLHQPMDYLFTQNIAILRVTYRHVQQQLTVSTSSYKLYTSSWHVINSVTLLSLLTTFWWLVFVRYLLHFTSSRYIRL